MSKVIMLPWVKEISECTIPVKVSDFEELRDWVHRIKNEYSIILEENIFLRKEINFLKEKIGAQP